MNKVFEEFQNRTPEALYRNKKKDSAVLIPLIEGTEGMSILFEVRAAQLLHQPGEICFPGGRCEEDEIPEQTAIREACEELLISSKQIKMVGPLDYFLSYAGFRVMPFLAIIQGFSNSFSIGEVEKIFTIPLHFFKTYHPQNYQASICVQPESGFPYEKIPGGKDYPFAKGILTMPFYEVNGHTIWGLTARLLKENLPLIFSVFPDC